MSRWKNLRQSDWQIELSPRKNVEPRIVGIRSTFRGSTFFRLVEIRLYSVAVAAGKCVHAKVSFCELQIVFRCFCYSVERNVR